MIKLIASDIDGTLLQNGARKIPDEIFTHIHRLREKGILFCPASGRQYGSLLGLFAPIAQESYFICENGAVVFGPGSPGSLLAKTVMERDPALALANEIEATPECSVLMSGANLSYICSRDPSLEYVIRYFVGNNLLILNRPEDIPEDIVKVSSYCRQGAPAVAEEMLPRWGGRFSGAVAGRDWLDFNAASKATGIREMCRILSISPDEVMAFGDNYNDLSMLQCVGHPYLMANGPEELRRSCPFPTCDTVAQVLETL